MYVSSLLSHFLAGLSLLPRARRPDLSRPDLTRNPAVTTVTHDQPPLPEATTDDVFPDLHPPRPLPVLVRATDGKSKERRKRGEKVKLSTVVEADALPAFFERYADVCKAGMATLKPRDRSKRKGKAKKKKAGAAAS